MKARGRAAAADGASLVAAVWSARDDAAATAAVDALRAAATTDAAAAALLGECLLRGWGVPRIDVDAAHACFLQAAKRGDTFAQGVCSREGLGGAADADAARAFFRAAAERGSVSALAAYGDAIAEAALQGGAVAREDDEDENEDDEDKNKEEDKEDSVEDSDEDKDEDEDRARGAKRTKRLQRATAPLPRKLAKPAASVAPLPEHPEDCWRRAADAGHPGAMTTLADLRPNNEAVKMLTTAARIGDAYAMRGLAAQSVRYGDAEGDASADVDAWFVRAYTKGLPGLAAKRAHALHSVFRNYSGTRSHGVIVAWFLRAAEAGDADAMFWYALCRHAGVAQRPDLAAVALWLRRAADTGHVPAMVSWAACLHNGVGVPRDQAAALPWLHAAAENGDAEAFYRIGKALFVGAGVPRDLAGAVQAFRKAALLGDPDACVALGRCYIGGWGVPAPDALQGFRWIARAAGTGLADGLMMLPTQERWRNVQVFENAAFEAVSAAAMVAVGWSASKDGIEEDRDWGRTVLWFRRAASLGDPEGLVRLGECLEKGHGVPTDAPAARACYEEAAALGDVAAKLKLVRLDPTLAERWRPSLPPLGAPTSATADRFGVDHPLALVNKNYREGLQALQARHVDHAMEKFREAAHQGHASAMATLGARLLADTKTAKEGREWLEKSASAGAPDGMTALAAVLEDDPTQHMRALDLYRAAAALDHSPAFIRLGRASLCGALGLPTNRAEGLGWFERAAVELTDPAGMVALAEAHLVTQATTPDEAARSRAAAQAVDWLERAGKVDQNHDGMLCVQGWLHLQGGVSDYPQDLAEARARLHDAVRAGCNDAPVDSSMPSEAATLLGMIAQYGLRGSAASEETAAEWYRAANNDYNRFFSNHSLKERAIYPLAKGKELELGLNGQKKNPKAAFALYTKLASLNSTGGGPSSPRTTQYDEFQARRLVAQALFCMAQCLEKGIGTRADRAEAMATYERAFDAGFLLAADFRQAASAPAKRARK